MQYTNHRILRVRQNDVYSRTMADPTSAPQTTTATTIRKIPQPGGRGALNSGGTPGNKGGRKPNWFRDWCDDLLAKKENKSQVEAILRNHKHPAYATMWKAVGERAHGKPETPIRMSGTVTAIVRYDNSPDEPEDEA